MIKTFNNNKNKRGTFILKQVFLKRLLMVIYMLGVYQYSICQEINWYSMDSGGGVASANGIELLGVIGQTDTTQMSAGEIKLSGGYLPLPDTSDVIFKDSFD